MTRINRPDTLLTELRDVKRRLRLLEAVRMRSAPATAADALAAPAGPAVAGEPVPVPLVPARPADWPGTSAVEWESLVVTWTARAGHLVLRLAADAGSEGQARVLVDGAPVGDVLPVPLEPARYELPVPAGEITVQARRTAGRGLVRSSAYITLNTVELAP